MPEFVPYRQFIDRLGSDKAEYHFDSLKAALGFTSGGHSRALEKMTKEKFVEEFDKICKHQLARYDNGDVVCEHTYQDAHGNFVDCIPFDAHPSVRAIHQAKGTVANRAPAPLGLPLPELADTMHRAPVLTPLVPPLLRGLRDRFGRPIACPDGCVAVRRFTPAELATYGTLESCLRKYHGKPNPPGAGEAPAKGKGGKKKAPAAAKTTKSKTKPAAPTAPPPAPQLGVDQHLYATCNATNAPGGPYSGCAVGLNVWDPNIGPGVFSLAQLWIEGANVGAGPETIESGWTVFPSGPGVGGSTDPVLFVYFNPDGYQGQSGYVGLLNQGFVPFSSPWVLMSGGQLPPSQTGSANQRVIHMMWVFFTGTHAGWYLYLGTTPQDWHGVGYFPAQNYTAPNSILRQGFGQNVRFGGEVCPVQGGFRTGQMGSGVYPNVDPEANLGEVAFCYSMFVRSDPNQNTMTSAIIAKGPTDDQFYGGEIPTSGRLQGFFFFGGAGAP